MKRKWIIGGIVAAPLVVAVVSFPVFARARENARRSSCANNLKQMALGLTQYAQDYDNLLPPVALRSAAEIAAAAKKKLDLPPYGWCDGMQPYVKSVCLLQCPSERSEPGSFNDTTKRGYTDYWFNARVAGHKLNFSNSASLIMNGDGSGNAQSDARYNVSTVPTNLNWESGGNGAQPAWPERHLGGANYTFLDGHVKWLRPGAVSNLPRETYTFAP